MYRFVIIFVLSFLCLTRGAIAGTIEMTCKNPGRSYLATLDTSVESFKIYMSGTVTAYQVNQIENSAEGTVVHGKTVEEGPDFAAHLGVRKRIEFSESGETFQIDQCK